jgi:threonyl-tRNA synthetase
MAERKTPRELLAAAGKLEKDVVAVKIGSRTVDLHTPVDVSVDALTPIKATDADGLAVIRHSTAHVMADAVQRLFPGTKVTIGPAIEDGFYYDFDKAPAGGGGFTDDDLRHVEKAMAEIIKRDTPFRRAVVTRSEARSMFSAMGETYKLEIIDAIPEGEEVSIYEHGAPPDKWLDVCEGPHVPSTGFLKAVRLTHVAGAYWRGDERNPMLQRIYGTAFSSVDALEEHLKLLEQARQRDHRKLGKELDLVMFDEVAPAMPFFLPKGAFVYNRMIQYVRDLYEREGYEEVITPQAFDPELFRTSGHLGNYNDNMFRLWTEDQLEAVALAKGETKEALQARSFALKPMNCPSHCVIFKHKRRSYRELPWRVADFGRLHRYERGGVVHGLARVRSFAQDDGHIFCAEDQVASEIARFMRFFRGVYKAFGFTSMDVKLATRPEKRIGSDDLWDKAERALSEGLEQVGLPFEVSPGEGAFYGPKIEFHVKDALKRSWQVGTMQHDPNLPQRFDLRFVGQDGAEHQPVMLHRAIFGSIERFFAVYLEHCGGNFPTWLAPRQAVVLTVSEKSDEYAHTVVARLKEKGLRVDADLTSDKLGAKIRNARLGRYPYLLVVGPKEAEADSVGVRSRDAGELGIMKVEELAARLLTESAPPADT